MLVLGSTAVDTWTWLDETKPLEMPGGVLHAVDLDVDAKLALCRQPSEELFVFPRLLFTTELEGRHGVCEVCWTMADVH